VRGNRRAALVLLAAGVAGLAGLACRDSELPPTTISAADSADQTFFGMTTSVTVNGVRRVQLHADTAYYFENRQVADLHGVHVTFFGPEGEQTSSLTADSGTYNSRTGDMEAIGNVVGVTPDGRRLTTSVLDYSRSTDRVSGPASFVFVTPDQHLEGDGFTADPDFRNVETKKPRGNLGRVELKQ